MNKAEAKKLLTELRAELGEKTELANRLRAELLTVQEKVIELQGVERYLAPLAGEPVPLREPAATKRGEMRGNVDAALAVLGDDTLTTGEIADRIIDSGYPVPPRGKLVSYLTTMLSRDARFERVDKGTWRRAAQSGE